MTEDRKVNWEEVNSNSVKIKELIDKNKTLKCAYSEAYDIIMHMDESLRSKISRKFIEFLYTEKDDSYIVDIDYSKKLSEEKLLDDTRVLMALIYRDYFLDKNIEQDKKEDDELVNHIEKTELVEYNENILEKIKRFFMNFFRK